MIIKSTPSRRHFLRQAAALSTLGLAANLDRIGLASAFAQSAPATDYKALVCVFLFGGNDGNNVVIPLDTAGYNQYAAVRTAASGLQLAASDLLPVTTATGSARYGLHPSFSGLQSLFNAGKMAVVANVGTLLAPITKADYTAGRNRPTNLFSHSDQQLQWQSAISDQEARSGWGGRLADKAAALNGTVSYPVVTSLAGANLFSSGVVTRPLASPTTATFSLAGYNTTAIANARLAALKDLMVDDEFNLFVGGANAISSQALSLSTVVNPILAGGSSSISTHFSGLSSGLSQQLLTVAKMIEARAQTGVKRQIFFVQAGGFDTHTGQLATQARLLTDVSAAMKAFYDATVTLGIASGVTSFTLSDFGRTLKAASGGGSDHAWGNHQFVVGGAVKGGDLYGRFPTLVLAGPDDVASEGRWLPSTSVDQYGGTLARWFGVSPADLASVFPNIGRFATPDLGFMAA